MSCLKTDAIFATSTRGLKLGQGTLSNCVLEEAGSGLQEECQSKYPSGIQHGQVAELGPGDSSFKQILLGAVPRCERRGGEQVPLDVNDLLRNLKRNARVRRFFKKKTMHVDLNKDKVK